MRIFSLLLMMGVTYLLWAPPLAYAADQGVQIERQAEGELQVTIRVGQLLTVRTAPEPGGTAYRWEIISSTTTVIERVAFRCEKSTAGPLLLGGAEATCFRFVGKERGQSDLQFARFAGHEYPGNDVADKFCLRVSVIE